MRIGGVVGRELFRSGQTGRSNVRRSSRIGEAFLHVPSMHKESSMQISAPPQIAAHIPAVNGYNPLGGSYGDAHILAGPSAQEGSFSSLDSAIDAAKQYGDTYDTAVGVFQALEGSFQIGGAVSYSSEDGPGELALSQKLADQVVFDDPSLVALVSYNSIARR
jgi:hypothetical protein